MVEKEIVHLPKKGKTMLSNYERTNCLRKTCHALCLVTFLALSSYSVAEVAQCVPKRNETAGKVETPILDLSGNKIGTKTVEVQYFNKDWFKEKSEIKSTTEPGFYKQEKGSPEVDQLQTSLVIGSNKQWFSEFVCPANSSTGSYLAVGQHTTNTLENLGSVTYRTGSLLSKGHRRDERVSADTSSTRVGSSTTNSATTTQKLLFDREDKAYRNKNCSVTIIHEETVTKSTQIVTVGQPARNYYNSKDGFYRTLTINYFESDKRRTCSGSEKVWMSVTGGPTQTIEPAPSTFTTFNCENARFIELVGIYKIPPPCGL